MDYSNVSLSQPSYQQHGAFLKQSCVNNRHDILGGQGIMLMIKNNSVVTVRHDATAINLWKRIVWIY